MTRRGVMFLRIATVAVIVVAFVIGGYFVTRRAEESRSEMPVLGKVPTFELLAQNGQTFSRKDLLGKVSVLDFVFTRCQGPCPIMSDHMEDLYKLYGSSDKVQFVSVSVDPTYDSVGVLQDYAAKHGVTDNRWSFLTGSLDSIKVLCEKGFMLAADNLPAGHSTKFVLIDGVGNIRGYYDGTDQSSVNILKTHINELVKKLK